MVVPTAAPWTAYPKVFGGADGVTITVAEPVLLVSALVGGRPGNRRFAVTGGAGGTRGGPAVPGGEFAAKAVGVVARADVAAAIGGDGGAESGSCDECVVVHAGIGAKR